jgi:hypothetical protein
MITDQEIGMYTSAIDVSMIQTIGIEYTYTITSVDSEGYTWADVVYTWIMYGLGSDMYSFVYDSSDPLSVPPPGAAYYQAMVGKGFSVMISPENKIEKVEGLEEMYDSILDEMGLLDPVGRDQMEQHIKTSFGDETIMDECEGFLFEIPEGVINAGDSWSEVLERSAPIPIAIEATYTLRTFDGVVAVFDTFSTVTTSGEGAMDFMGMELRYELYGTQQGFIEMDAETGLVVFSELVQDLSGEAVATFEGEETRMPMTIKSFATITIVNE